MKHTKHSTQCDDIYVKQDTWWSKQWMQEANCDYILVCLFQQRLYKQETDLVGDGLIPPNNDAKLHQMKDCMIYT